MIRYNSQNQLNIENFDTPFDRALDPENRWVKLASLLPWDEMAQIYYTTLSPDMGRPSLDARVVIGSIIIKHYLNLSDREVVKIIQENIYIQYFIGLSSFQPQPVFDASLFVEMRKRLGLEQFDEMICRIIEKAKDLKKNEKSAKSNEADQDGKDEDRPAPAANNKGRLKLDATVADQMILFPTDFTLLNQARLESERIIDILYKKSNRWIKPRTYRRIARNSFLGIAKKRKKTKKAESLSFPLLFG